MQEAKDKKDENPKNSMYHIAKAYSIYQTYIWTMIVIVGGILLLIKFLL